MARLPLRPTVLGLRFIYKVPLRHIQLRYQLSSIV